MTVASHRLLCTHNVCYIGFTVLYFVNFASFDYLFFLRPFTLIDLDDNSPAAVLFFCFIRGGAQQLLL